MTSICCKRSVLYQHTVKVGKRDTLLNGDEEPQSEGAFIPDTEWGDEGGKNSIPAYELL